MPSVKFLWVTTEARGAPRFLCHHSVILGRKICPSAFRDTRVSLISTPTRLQLSASQRLPCASRRTEAEKKGVGKPQFDQHFTVAPRKHCERFCRYVSGGACLRVGVYCCEGKTDGL